MPTFSGVLAMALASGVNLYATALTLGLAIRFGWMTSFPPELSMLANPWMLTFAGSLYLIEFVADKIPFVTPIWDAIHTVIRPLGAALLAAQSVSDLHPGLRLAAVLMSGSAALASHSGKMSFRLAAHVAPDPVTHSAISIGEDVGVVGLLVLAWSHPVAALLVSICLLVAIAYILRLAYRALKTAPARFRRLFGILPARHSPNV